MKITFQNEQTLRGESLNLLRTLLEKSTEVQISAQVDDDYQVSSIELEPIFATPHAEAGRPQLVTSGQ
jgi:hypothetical protein